MQPAKTRYVFAPRFAASAEVSCGTANVVITALVCAQAMVYAIVWFRSLGVAISAGISAERE